MADPATDSPLAPLLPHLAALQGFVRKRVADPTLADDVLQEALLRAVRAVAQLRDPDDLLPWMYRILRHAIADALRQRAVAQGRTADAVDDLPATPADDAVLCACLRGVIAGLKPADAAVLEADLANTPASATAAQLGITSDALKVRRHRARQELRARLERTCRLCAVHGCLDCHCASRADGATSA